MSQDAPVRFSQETRTERERDFLGLLAKKVDSSPLSPVERMQSFPLYIPRQDLTRYLCRYELFKRILDKPGHIVECGCLYGGGVAMWAHLCSMFEPFNHARRVVGFDTFEGFAELSAEDKGATYGDAHEGGLAVDSQAEIQACAALHDLNRPIGHIPRVELVRGDAVQTIPKWAEENRHAQVALLWLDFDVYAPTRAALETLLDGKRMSGGTVVAFDDLGLPQWPGEARAYREFASRLGPLQRFPWGPTTCWAEVR